MVRKVKMRRLPWNKPLFGCGLLALRASRALACVALPRKTVHRTYLIAASNLSEQQTQKEEGHKGLLLFGATGGI